MIRAISAEVPKGRLKKDEADGALNKSITAFMGIAYKLKTGRVFIEAGGNYGLYDIQRYAENGSNFSFATAIMAGYQVPFNYKHGNKKSMLQ